MGALVKMAIYVNSYIGLQEMSERKFDTTQLKSNQDFNTT
jgi:hypothetical protein